MKYDVNDYFNFRENQNATREFTYTVSNYLNYFGVGSKFKIDNGLIDLYFDENSIRVTENPDQYGNSRIITLNYLKDPVSISKDELAPSLSINYYWKTLNFEIIMKTKEENYYRIDTIKFDGKAKENTFKSLNSGAGKILPVNKEYWLNAINRLNYFNEAVDSTFHYQIALYDKDAVEIINEGTQLLKPFLSEGISDIQVINIDEINPVSVKDLVMFRGEKQTAIGEFNNNRFTNSSVVNNGYTFLDQLDDYCLQNDYNLVDTNSENINSSYQRIFKTKHQ